MITPAYSPTATERVLPRLALDFTTGVLDPRVTVTRALDTATRVNSSGIIEIVNANLPRFDYDPVTFAPKGLLIEESRANAVLRSQLIGGTSWTSLNAVCTTNNLLAPDGTVSATLFTENTANAAHLVYGTNMTLPVSANTVSVYVKGGTRRYVSIRGETTVPASSVYAWVTLDTQTGSVATNAAVTSASAVNAGNGWWRVSMTWANAQGTASAANIVFAGSDVSTAPAINSTLGNVYTGTSSTFYVWGAQVETGAFATSYIPTTTTSLTRNADVVSMTGTNFSSWYNASEGAFAITAELFNASSTAKNPFGQIYGTATSTMFMGKRVAGAAPTDFQFYVANSGTQAFITPIGALAANNTLYTGVCAYKLDSFQAACRAIAGTPDTSGTVPTGMNAFAIGSSGTETAFLNGRVTGVRYWPQRLTNAEVQAFSK